jgi:hypothetical protein
MAVDNPYPPPYEQEVRNLRADLTSLGFEVKQNGKRVDALERMDLVRFTTRIELRFDGLSDRVSRIEDKLDTFQENVKSDIGKIRRSEDTDVGRRDQTKDFVSLRLIPMLMILSLLVAAAAVLLR